MSEIITNNKPVRRLRDYVQAVAHYARFLATQHLKNMQSLKLYYDEYQTSLFSFYSKYCMLNRGNSPVIGAKSKPIGTLRHVRD